MAMTRADKLRQSIEAVHLALGQLAASAEPYHCNAAGEVDGARIDINPQDDGGPWREACDMIAQAREEARALPSSERPIRGRVLAVVEVEVRAEEGAEVEALQEAVTAAHAELSGGPLGACLTPFKLQSLTPGPRDTALAADGIEWEEVDA